MEKNNVQDIARLYTYRVFWSQEDEKYVGTCAEFPSLSGLAKTAELALKEISQVVLASVEWMLEDGEKLPEPISAGAFKGLLTVRTTPENHRDLTIRAAEAGVSMNNYILSHIAGESTVSKEMEKKLQRVEKVIDQVLKTQAEVLKRLARG